MDEHDQQMEQFDLDEIMREFGSPKPAAPEEAAPGDVPAEPPATEASAPEAPAPEETAQEAPAPEEAVQQTPAPEESAQPENPAPDAQATPDTQPAEQAAQPEADTASPMTGDTVRLQSLSDVRGSEKPPREEAPAAPEPEAPAEPAVEPFSENWEPEYDEPIGPYVPPQPIVFRPRSRLRELKRQLIAGPEKRYYELSERGTGKLQLAILLCLLLTALSAAVYVLFATGIIPQSRLKLTVFLQFFTMLLCALLGCFQLLAGVTDLFRGHFTLNTMLVLTFFACCVDGVAGLWQARVPCCAAFGLEIAMSLWQAYEKRITEQGQMDTMRKAVRLDSVAAAPDYPGGTRAFLRGEGQVAHFMDTYAETPRPEKRQMLFALIASCVSVVLGVVAGVLHGTFFGIQVLSVSLLAALPATAFIAVSRPLAVLERRLHRVGAVLCGWQGVEGLRGEAVFPVGHEDLFPAGAAVINGVKFYGDRDTDQIVAYTAALIRADGGGLSPLFAQLLESRNGRHYDAENLQRYGNGGIGGEVDGEPVLVGVRSFMKEMGVEIPDGTRVSEGVYIAIDGELCGLFALTYHRVKSAASGLSALCGCRKLHPTLVSNDFVLTDAFIRERFGVNTRRITFPPQSDRPELAAAALPEDAQALALTTSTGLDAPAYAVAGARAAHTACRVGVIVHMLAGALGLVMMGVLAVLGRADLLTPGNLFLYQLVWALPGLLISEWARSV